jgi:hypothetical protein
VNLPGIGQIGVHDDTRRLRRLLAKDRAKILFATVSLRAGRCWVSVNVEAADLHPAHRHPPRSDADHGGWVGVDLLDNRRSVRPEAEYREPTEQEWREFHQHFHERKLELGTCGRP